MKTVTNIFLILGLGVFLLFPQLSESATDDVFDIDGNQWQEWNAATKVNFLTGFLLGSVYVIQGNMTSFKYIEENEYLEKKALDALARFWSEDKSKQRMTFSRNEVAQMLEWRRRVANKGLLPYVINRITNGQIKDGLDSFYIDFKNRQIKISDAIFVVKKQIKGVDQEEVDAILQWLRADKDASKGWYTDKAGQKKWVSFP